MWLAELAVSPLPVSLCVCVSKSSPYYCFRSIFLTFYSHNSCDPCPVLISYALFWMWSAWAETRALETISRLGEPIFSAWKETSIAWRFIVPSGQMVLKTSRRPERKTTIENCTWNQIISITPTQFSTRTRANAQSPGKHLGGSLPNMTSTEHRHGLPYERANREKVTETVGRIFEKTRASGPLDQA